MQLLKRRGGPIRKRFGSEFMLLVTCMTSSFADVDTSREPYTKNVGFRSHVACNSVGLLALQLLKRRGNPIRKMLDSEVRLKILHNMRYKARKGKYTTI